MTLPMFLNFNLHVYLLVEYRIQSTEIQERIQNTEIHILPAISGHFPVYSLNFAGLVSCTTNILVP